MPSCISSAQGVVFNVDFEEGERQHQGGNVSALAMASIMKLGPTASLIGKELSLLYYEAQFEPEVIHILGITNVLADSLSRLHDPNDEYEIPPALAKLEPTPVPVRDENFYWVLAT